MPIICPFKKEIRKWGHIWVLLTRKQEYNQPQFMVYTIYENTYLDAMLLKKVEYTGNSQFANSFIIWNLNINEQ
jgi:hypothetical protein